MDLWRLAWQSVGTNNAAPSGGGTTYAETLLALSPTGYWRLGEASGSPQDSSGNALHLTAAGTPTYDVAGWTGDSDGGMTFDGSTEWLTRADDALFDIGTSDFSMSWCMKRSGTPGAEMAIMGHDQQSFAGEWGCHLTATSNLLTVKLDNANYNLFHTGTLYDDAWHHCVLTCDRDGNATLYVDGSSVGTVSIAAKSAVALDNTRTFWIAARDTSSGWPYAGSLDEVAFWKSTLLTSGNVTTLYAARNGTGGGGGTQADIYAASVATFTPLAYYKMDEPSGTTMADSSSTGNAGSYVNSPALGAAGPFEGATGVTFDGTNYASAPEASAIDFTSSGDFTLTLWFKIAAATWSTAAGHLIGRSGDGGWNDYEVDMGAGDIMKCRFGNAGETSMATASSNATVDMDDGAWHFLALTADRDGNATWYIDGAAHGATSIASYQHALDASSPLYIARRATTHYFTGSICQVSIFGSALSGANISTLYAAAGF